MTDRPEPLLAERLWVHPTGLALADVTVAVDRDDAGRPVTVRYSDGGVESYRYDDRGRLAEIDEHVQLWETVEGPVHRWESGGRLLVVHDDQGPLRISGPHNIVWERCDEPWPDLLQRGASSLADRCVAAIAAASTDPALEVYCLVLTYVGDSGLYTTLAVGTEEGRRAALAADDPWKVACDLWHPESDELGLVEVEYDEPLDELLMREAALNVPGEAQRTVLTATAQLLARRDWDGLLSPTEDFVVFIAEHDEGFADKHVSVRAVNPPERIAAWDAAWPAGVPRDDD